MLAFALLVGACRDDSADLRAPRSGDRIKLVHYEYEDGTIERERGFFYDNDLGALCYEETWSDGARYCTPRTSEAMYTNERCSQMLGVVTGPSAPKFVATYYFLHDKPLVSALFRIGEPTTPPPVVWRMTDLGCVGPFVDDNSSHHWYTVGEPVAITDTRIKHTVPEGLDRLVDLFLTTGDGMQIAVDIYDQEIGLPCQVDGDANEMPTTCKPALTDGYVSFFTDEACSAPIVPVTGPPPLLARREDPATGCTSYYRITSEQQPASVYQLIGDRCVRQTSRVAAHYYGAEPLELVSVERRHVGQGRLHPIALGDLATPDRLLYDAKLGTDCERVLLPAGDLRCLPVSSARLYRVFTDSACRQPTDVAIVASRACDRPETYVRDAAIHAIGGVYTAPLYELTADRTCGPLLLQAGYLPHAIGPALPLETFPLATMSYEP
ncbi:MAG: hypothetical protein HOV81_34285 [Kofleriaceae bacterium]|nr:hypothetical protein [Kofleriaceae bacterium]